MQQRLAGDVTDEVGSGALLSAKSSRAQLAILTAVEDDAHALEGEYFGACLGAEDLDSVLVAEVVAAPNRVERVVFPRVVLGYGCVDATLGSVEWLRTGCTFEMIATSALPRAADPRVRPGRRQ